MRTSDAVAKIREKLGLNQKQLAERLCVTPTTVWRYEHGQEPAEQVSAALEGLAKEAGLTRIAELFAAKRNSAIANRVDALSTPGSARPIPLWLLSTWQGNLSLALGSARLDMLNTKIDACRRLCPKAKAHLDDIDKWVQLLIDVGDEIYTAILPYLEGIDQQRLIEDLANQADTAWPLRKRLIDATPEYRARWEQMKSRDDVQRQEES